MEDKSGSVSSLCGDVHSKKIRVRKGRPARRASHMSTSAGGPTTSHSTITAHIDQTKTSNSDSCEEEKLSDHDRFTAKQVKEEYVSSRVEGDEDVSSRVEEGDEDVSPRVEGDDVSSGEGEKKVSSRKKDLGNIEALLVKDPPVTQQKQRRAKLKFHIRRSREISEDLRKQVVEAHKNGKGYKRISKDLDLHLSTVRKIVYKWKKFSTVATLPRSGRPTKISAKARRTILRHMRENTMVTAKDLKASLALDNINVHESTIRKTLSKWCSWDFTMEETPAPQPE